MEHEIQVFPGVPHGQSSQSGPLQIKLTKIGFAVVGEYDDAKIMEAQRAAFEQMLSWLKSH